MPACTILAHFYSESGWTDNSEKFQISDSPFWVRCFVWSVTVRAAGLNFDLQQNLWSPVKLFFGDYFLLLSHISPKSRSKSQMCNSIYSRDFCLESRREFEWERN